MSKATDNGWKFAGYERGCYLLRHVPTNALITFAVGVFGDGFEQAADSAREARRRLAAINLSAADRSVIELIQTQLYFWRDHYGDSFKTFYDSELFEQLMQTYCAWERNWAFVTKYQLSEGAERAGTSLT